MFTDEQLEQYLQRRNLSESARKLIRQLRSTDPQRRAESTAVNCSGRFPSLKMKRSIQAESRHGELSTVWIWEYDDETYEFWDQVPQIKFSTLKSNGQPGGHLATVDYFVLQEKFTGWVEIERRDAVKQKVNAGDLNYYKDDTGRWHYRPGEEYAQPFGLGFQLVLVDEVNQTLAANNQFLADYRKPDQPAVPEEAQAFIRSIVDYHKAIRLIDLVRHEPIKADHVYWMIAAGLLFVSLEVERLGEPERTLVYADQPSAAAHFCEAEVAHRGPPRLEIRRAELTPGASLVWDGKVWTILNVGAQYYALQDAERRVHEFEHEQLHQLVSAGVIVAPQASESSASARLNERLLRASPQEHEAATRRYRAVKGLTGAEDKSIPSRTLRHWRHLYRRGEQMFGCGYAGLLPFYSRQGNRNRKLSPRTLEIIRATIDAEHMRTPHAWPKVTPVLGKVNLALKEVLLPTVSEKTIARELRHGFRPEEIVAKRDGNRAAYAHRPMYWRLDMDTPLHGQRPFEVGHIDHTLVDIQLIDERFRRKTRKVWATALIDAYDREVLAVFLTFSPPSAASAMAVIRACVKRHGRVPQTIVYDNGKEFKSAAFERLLMALEVAGVARPKGSPKHGAMIERLFRRWNDDLVHNMQGNNVALQTPRMMSASHDPRRNAIWTFDAFHRAFTQYLYEVYPKMLHQGLGVTPLEARDQGLRDFGQRPQDHIKFDEAFELLCMPEHPKELKVQKGGQVRRINLDYQHPDLNDATLIGRKVEVRFDPFDASRILVFAKGKWLIAHCRLQAVFARYTPAEVDRATQRMVELKSWVRSFRSLNAETIASFLCAVEAKEVELIAKKFSRDANVKEAMEAAIKAVRALHDDFFTYVADGTTPEAANDATATEDVEPDADAAAPQPSSLQALFRQQAAA